VISRKTAASILALALKLALVALLMNGEAGSFIYQGF